MEDHGHEHTIDVGVVTVQLHYRGYASAKDWVLNLSSVISCISMVGYDEVVLAKHIPIGSRIQCILSNDYMHELMSLIETDTHCPKILIIQFGTVFIIDGIVKVRNLKAAIRLFLNGDVHENHAYIRSPIVTPSHSPNATPSPSKRKFTKNSANRRKTNVNDIEPVPLPANVNVHDPEPLPAKTLSLYLDLGLFYLGGK
ncbi:hypothetical protein Tco_0018327 [Tanacetum coccineum]